MTILDTPEGYVIEASVPLDFLGGNLWANRSIPGDAGIIVADSTGRRVARICRFNSETQVVSDVPTEAALQPERWGTILVDKK